MNSELETVIKKAIQDTQRISVVEGGLKMALDIGIKIRDTDWDKVINLSSYTTNAEKDAALTATRVAVLYITDMLVEATEGAKK